MDTSRVLALELEMILTIVGELIPMIIPSKTITASNSIRVKPFLFKCNDITSYFF